MLFKETKIFVLIYIKDIYIPSLHTTHTYTCVYISVKLGTLATFKEGNWIVGWEGEFPLYYHFTF